jgi:hypothetical protein
MSDAPQPRRYLLITTVDTTGPDGETIPAGTPINEVLWDGVSDWTPPEGSQAMVDAGHYAPEMLGKLVMPEAAPNPLAGAKDA